MCLATDTRNIFFYLFIFFNITVIFSYTTRTTYTYLQNLYVHYCNTTVTPQVTQNVQTSYKTYYYTTVTPQDYANYSS